MNALIEKLPNHCASSAAAAVVYEMVFHNSEHSYVVCLDFSICQIVFNTSHSTKLNTLIRSKNDCLLFITKMNEKQQSLFL